LALLVPRNWRDKVVPF